jgi:7tm Odorant receptor
MFLEAFFPCFFASEKLSESLYKSQWMQADKKFKKAMIIIKENLKIPVDITAIRMMKVNLSTLARICNFAYSVFALLKRVNE